MELAMKVEELNLEPRELTIGELEDASGGFILFALGFAAGVGIGIAVGLAIAHYYAR